MAIDKVLVDPLLAKQEAKDLFAKGGMTDDMKKPLSGRVLAAELKDHHETDAEAGLSNRRNRGSRRTMLSG